MQPTDEEMENCIDKAISEAISKNILVDYLAIEDAENLLREGDSPEKVARCIGLSLEKVLEIQQKISVNA